MFLPHLDVIDRRFASLALQNAHLDLLWTGARWLEGPAWFAAGRYLVMSDIPGNRMLRWDETDGGVSEFRAPANFCNGATRDRAGRLISCEHLTRRVVRWEHDGSCTVIAERFQGKRLNSPNDVVEAPDGAIWFTDPTYGIDSDYEGRRATPEYGGSYLFRVGPDGVVQAMAQDFVQPNGLAFSPDGGVLYVADTGASHVEGGPRHIRRFSVASGGFSGGEVFSQCTVGMYDGFRVDRAGNLWASSGEGVHCLTPDGRLIGRILIPEVVANLCFGGAAGNRLFICATTSLYATYLGISG